MITQEEKIEILERWIETRIALDKAKFSTSLLDKINPIFFDNHRKADKAYQQMLAAEHHEEEQ